LTNPLMAKGKVPITSLPPIDGYQDPSG